MSTTDNAAVVTGATSGIGKALALALTARGTRVGAIGRRSDRLLELQSLVQSRGGTLEIETADVSDREGLHNAVHRLNARLGTIGLVIANAGVSEGAAGKMLDVDSAIRIMNINFFGVLYCFEPVLESMRKRNAGHLVAISSMAAYKGLPGSAAYCASKSALSAYMEALRIELCGSGVAVTTVCPGFIRTEMTQNRKHAIPMVMDADQAAYRILSALSGRPAVFNFPFPMRILMEMTRWIPDAWIAKQVGKES